MWPVKPAMDMWSNRPAVLIQTKMSKKQIRPQDDDKNCLIIMKQCVLARNVKLPSATRKLTKTIKQVICSK